MDRALMFYWICATLANSCRCYSICLRPKSLCGVYDVSHILEQALVNDSDTIFMLRQGFFPSNGAAPEHRGIHIIINVTQRDSLMDCSPEDSNPAFQLQENEDGQYFYTASWKLVWSSSPLLPLITQEKMMLFDSGIVSIAVIALTSIRLEHKFSFALHLTDSFHCIPTMQDLTTSLTTLVSWLKAYARAGGVPSTWNREDQGQVAWQHGSGIGDIDVGFAQYFRMSLLVTFTTLNVLVAILAAQMAPKAYAALTKRLLDDTDLLHTQRRKSNLFSIYWACIFVVGAINLFNTIFSVGYYTMCSFTTCNFYNGSSILVSLLEKGDAPPNDKPIHVYVTEKDIFIVKITLLPLLLAMELLVSVCTHKHTNFPVPYKLVNILCCCCCCPTRFQSKVVQTVALWQILVFIQNLTCALFPMTIFLLVNPLLATSAILILLSLFISLIVVAAHLFKLGTSPSYRRHRRSQSYNCRRWKKLGSFCLQLLGIVSFFIFMIGLFALYIIIIVRGVTAGSLLGAVVCLVPSIIIDVIMGWHMKKTFFSNRIIVHDPQNGADNGQQIGLASFDDKSDDGSDALDEDEPLLRNNDFQH